MPSDKLSETSAYHLPVIDRDAVGKRVNRRRAVVQLRHVLAVLRHERRTGTESEPLADRAEEVVEHTVVDIQPEPDEALRELIAYVEREIAELRDRTRD